jgi:hypothetical protein
MAIISTSFVAVYVIISGGLRYHDPFMDHMSLNVEYARKNPSTEPD